MSVEQSPLGAPEEFDLEAWLSDAKRPERAVTIYKRADLLADLDLLERKISDLGRIPDADRGMNDDSSALEAEYLSLAEKFSASALEVRVHGLTAEETAEIGKKANAAGEDAKRVGYRLLEAAMVYPKLPVEGIERLAAAIGTPQINMIVQAYQSASFEAPVVHVPFSQRSYKQANTEQ